MNLCRQKLSNKLCAVKSININKVGGDNPFKTGEDNTAVQRITTEKEILKELRHPNIVKLYEAIHDHKEGYELLYMELCTGGDMLQYLRKRRRLTESMAKFFMKQLMEALGYLHHLNIVHRDIKLENILLSNLGQIKLCDFGIAEVVEKEWARRPKVVQPVPQPSSPNSNSGGSSAKS